MNLIFSAGKMKVISCIKQQQQLSLLCGDTPFLKPLLRQHKPCCTGHHTYVSGSVSVQQAAINTQPVPFYRSYQLDTKRPFPPLQKCSGVVFLRTAAAASRNRAGPATGRSCSHTQGYSDTGILKSPHTILNPCPPLWTENLPGVTIPANQVLPASQRLPAAIHQTDWTHRSNSVFYETEVRLLLIKIVHHLWSSLG